MKLHWSPRSPFVRKVMVFAHETGLVDRLTCVRTVVAMKTPNAALLPDNPLSKFQPWCWTTARRSTTPASSASISIRCMIGRSCFQPTARRGGPRCGARRSVTAFSTSCCCGATSASDRRRRRQLLDAFAAKYRATMMSLEQEATALDRTPFGIGHIAIGCGLSYLDFRFADLDWRGGYPQIAAWHASFAQRPSAKATEAVEG